MKFMSITYALVAVIGLSAAGCVTREYSTISGSKQSATTVTLLSFHDFHGRAEPAEVKVGINKVKVGGFEIMKPYFDRVREENDNTFLFTSGDLFQGTLVSDLTKGEALISSLNSLDVTAGTLGNHEFDWGQERLRNIVKRLSFPMVSTNITNSNGEVVFSDTKRLVRSYLARKNGLRIGVLGVTTPTTPKETSPTNVEGLKFLEFKDVVRKEAEELRKDGAHLVVLLSHAGGTCDMSKPAEAGDTACSQDDEISLLLKSLPKHTVDVVFAAHIHAPQAHFIAETPVLQTEGNGTSFARIDFTLDTAAKARDPFETRVKRVEISQPTYFCHQQFENYASCDAKGLKPYAEDATALGAPIPAMYRGKSVTSDPGYAVMLKPFQDKVASVVNEVVGKLPVALDNDRTKETPVQNCVADLLKNSFEKEFGVSSDVIVTNSAGIRKSIPAGNVTRGTIFEVLPFDNNLVLAELNGAELNRLGSILSVDPKNIAVVSSGWKVRLKNTSPSPTNSRHITFVAADGAALNDSQIYKTVIPDFLVDTNPELFARVTAEKKIHKYFKFIREYAIAGLRNNATELPQSCRQNVVDGRIEILAP